MVIITEEVIIHSTRKEKKSGRKGKKERQKRKLKNKEKLRKKVWTSEKEGSGR